MASVPTGQQYEILALLASMPKELTAVDILDFEATIAEGSIYTTLMRLETKGFVTSRKETVAHEPGRPRRYYKITALGRRAMQLSDEMAGARMLGPRLTFGSA